MFNDVIDTQKGIAYMAGKKEIYAKIAGTFIKGKDTKTGEFREFFEKEDFERLTIEFHGMKSSSASMGSTLLPKISLELEMAGKEGNIGLIKERFEEFLAQYEDTCGALSEVLAQL